MWSELSHMYGSRHVATANAGDVGARYESLVVNLLRFHKLGQLTPYVCISAFDEAVGKMRNCGMGNAEGEMRNGPEWNLRIITAERRIICGMQKVASALQAEYCIAGTQHNTAIQLSMDAKISTKLEITNLLIVLRH